MLLKTFKILLNCKILLPQNTFKAKSMKAFKKWIRAFRNFVHKLLYNTVQVQPVYQVPKLLIAMRKKDTFKALTSLSIMSYMSFLEKNELCGSSSESPYCSQTEEMDFFFLPRKKVTALTSQHSFKWTLQSSPLIHYSRTKYNTEKQNHFPLAL